LRGDQITDMKGKEEARKRERETRKFEARRRNAELAQKLLKINSDYDPLWNPPPHAPLIWRVGAGIVGMFLFLFGSGIFCLWYQEHSWGLFAVSALFILASIRPLWNAIHGRKSEPASRADSRRK
jgi:hypothetical protein